MVAISPSSKYTAFWVYSINGEASEAIKNSSVPTPITSGLPKRATTISCGLPSSITAIAKAPTTSLRA